MNEHSKLKKNPSRETCESIIRRILTAEVSEKGTNAHFRQASDFMGYFESLYPASDSLTKQVQRAVRSMDLPKDEHGCFIINKSKEQLDLELNLKQLVRKESFSLDPMMDCETVFIHTESGTSAYLIHLLNSLETIRNLYVTMLETTDGVLIFTQDKSRLLPILEDISKN